MFREVPKNQFAQAALRSRHSLSLLCSSTGPAARSSCSGSAPSGEAAHRPDQHPRPDPHQQQGLHWHSGDIYHHRHRHHRHDYYYHYFYYFVELFLFVVFLRHKPVFVSAADRPEFSANQVEPRGQAGEQRSAHQPLLLMRPQTCMALSESNMKMCFINNRVLISQISTEARHSGLNQKYLKVADVFGT